MGCTPVATSNWYSWFANEMRQRPGVTECVLRDFPDPYQCKESVWVPFVTDDVGLDEDTIIVGHSSGAACAMRLLESEPKKVNSSNNPSSTSLHGAVLVASAYTDMGDKSERRSEYFNRPWNWETMKRGAKNIALFHGTDDHLIPVAEARYIAEKLKGDNFKYYEMTGVSHFFQPWNEILEVVDNMIQGIESDS